MIENLNSKAETYQIKESNSEEIDLKLILNLLLRNKLLIGLIAFISFIVGNIYSLTVEKIWEGQFQIVLNNGPGPAVNPGLEDLIGLGTSNNNLNTEVEILKSPSVLMPVFEYAKSKNAPLSSKLLFESWKKRYLNINLQNDTSILNISYRNTDKDTIIPILKKMSISYQQYSGKNKRRSQELKNDFLNAQIALFKKKSANSLKAVQEYAIDQDLVFNDSTTGNRNTSEKNSNQLDTANLDESNNLLLSNFKIENARVQAANQIRKINLQLKKIQELNDSEELQYIGSTIPTLVNEGLPKALSNIEQQLALARLNFTENDIAIKKLISQRDIAIDLLKKRTIKYLEVQKIDAEATMEAAMRPKGVLLKYKELIRESARDEFTLVELEDQLNLLKLELASKVDPWELITKPTLLGSPVFPNKKRITFLSLVAGSILGIAFSVLKEKRSDIIYDSPIIEKLIPIKVISKINLNKIDFENQNLLLLKDFLDKKTENPVNFVTLGNIQVEELNKLKQSLIKEKFAKDIEFSSNNSDTKKYSNYLILKLGSISYSDILILKKRLDLFENPFKGLVVLS